MSHSLPPKSERSSNAADLPKSLAEALEKVRQAPEALETWAALDESCREHDRPDEAAALYTEVLSSELEAEALEQIGRAAADFCEEWYEETAPVLEMLSLVLKADPKQSWAFERLTVLLTVAAEWDALLKAYDTALEATEVAREKQALLEEAAKVARDFASKPLRASEYLKALLLLRLTDEQLAISLERRLDEQERHHDLIDIWTARLAVLSESAALKTRIQIAARYLDFLEDAASSLLVVDEFLEKKGDELEACSVLERIADKANAETDVRREALQRLDRLHTAGGRYHQVISAVERALVLAETPAASIVLHRRAVELLTKVENYDSALEHCAKILALDATADEVRSHARSLASRIGRLDKFAEAIVIAADSSEVGERRVELLVEAANVYRQDLEAPRIASELYFRVVEDDAADDAVQLLACQELSALLEEADRREDLLAILERRADLEGKAEERKRILGQAAVLATDLRQLERALGLWSLRLNDDASDDEALSAKIVLFVELERFQGLVEALEARALLGGDVARKRDDMVRAATVRAERLGDLKTAIATWVTIEERFGRVSESLDSLIALSARVGLHEQVVSLLLEGIESEVDPARRVHQLGQLGDTLRMHLQKNEDALNAYRTGLEIDPRDPVARSGLRALVVNKSLAHEGAEALARAFRRAQDFSDIVELVEVRLDASPDANFSSDILLEAAAIEEQAENLSSALKALARAFALVPAPTTETELHRLAEATGDWEAAAVSYGQAIEGLEDDDRIGALFLARGRVEEDQLLRPDSATDSYREAVKRAPSDAAIVHSMVRAAHRAGRFADAAWAVVENSRALEHVSDYQLEHFASRTEEHGNWEGALEGLADRIAAAEELPAQVAHDLKSQLAVWYRDKLHDPDSAEMVLKRAVTDHPQESSLRMLAELQRRAPGTPLVVTLTSLADVCGDELAVLREAGEVALDPVGDDSLSEPILERALRVASKRFAEAGSAESDHGFEASDVCAWATDHLVKLALDSSRRDRAVDLLEASSLLPFDPVERVGRRFRAAEVAALAANDERAVELCEAVLAAESKHDGAITLLSALHEKAGRLEQLLELRRREISLDRPQDRRLFLRLDQARVLGEIGEDQEARIQVLNENLADMPGHEASIAALSEVLTKEQEFGALVEMLESQAASIADREPQRAALLWEKAGQLAEDELNDESRLAANFKLSAAAHASVPVLDRLAFIAEAQEDWESEVSWLQSRLSLTAEVFENEQGPADRRSVVVRLAKAHVRNEDRHAARACLELELSKDPPADTARKLLAKIYRQLQEWHELSQLLAGGVEYAPDDASQIAYLKSAAQVERRQLSNLDAAVPFLERAIAIDPQDRGLKLLLADTLRAAEHYEPAAEILTSLLEEFGRRRTKERAVVHQQLARIAQARGDLDEALEQAEAAAKIERTDAGILMLVGQLAREKGQLDRAEQAYRTLALIASRRTTSAPDEDSDEVGESAILFELYRIAMERGDTQQSRELLDSALEVATRDPNEAMRLAESLHTANQIDLLLGALEQRLQSGIEGSLAANLLVTKANVLERCERTDEALEARLQALSATPQDGLLVDATQKLAERLGAAAVFWSHIERLAEQSAEQPLVAGELWYRAGLAAETEEQDFVRAAQLYELAQRSGHKPKRSFLALDRVLDAHSSPDRVRQALQRFVASEGSASSPDVLADALYRLAQFELSGGALDEASSHLMQALEVDAQDERVLSMLEPVVRAGVASDRIVILFLRVCRRAASSEVLLFAFRNAVQAQTVEQSVLDEAIALARELDDAEALRELLSRAIAVATERDESREVRSLFVERAGLARSDEEFQLEAQLLEQAIPLFEGADRFELELRLANCVTEHLGLVEQGQESFERLLKDAPEDGRVWRPLLALYRSGGRMDAVEALIVEIEEHVTDETDLETLKLERVRLMVNADRLEEAEEELRKALAARPQMTEAAAILASLLRKAERWEELQEMVESLHGQARERKDGRLVSRYGRELAELVVGENREEAINILNADLELTRNDRDLLVYLLSLYTDDDNQSERADVMEYLLALESGSSARELAFALTDLRSVLGDDYGAGRAMELGVKVAPDDAQMVQRYVDFLRTGDDYLRLSEALMVQAGQLGSTEAAAELYAEAATIFDENLGDPAQAAAASEKAFNCDPTNMAYLEKCASLLVLTGDVDGALSRLSVAIESGDEMALADLLELRANIIRRERLGDRQAMIQAANDLRAALEQLIPEEQEHALQQARIEVLTELRSLHQSQDDVSGERGTVLELANLLTELGDSAGGIDVLASWIRDHEEDLEVTRELGERATRAGDHSAAVFAYQKLVEGAVGDEKVSAVLALASAAEAAGEPTEARTALEAAFAEDPTSTAILERLRSMYEAVGAYHELGNLLFAEAEKAEDLATKSDLLVQVGDLYLLADDGDAACAVYEQAREISESPFEIISKLANAYLAQGDVQQASTVLGEAVEAHGKRRSPELALLQHGLARVAEANGNAEEMFAWLEAALMSDRNNGEVARELAVRGQEEGRYDIAVKALQSLTLSKVAGPMSKGEAYLRQAQISQIQGDPKKALLMARRAQSTEPDLLGVDELIAELGG